MTLMLALLLAAQTTPMQPMPKGTALPPPASEEAAVLAPVTAIFAALAAQDGPALLAHVRADGGANSVTEQPDGSRTVAHHSWAELVAGFKPGGSRLEERLLDPAVEIDGDIAMVWGRYDFLVDGKLQHCGYDHFDMVREAGSWKIANLSWSSRTTGCAG